MLIERVEAGSELTAAAAFMGMPVTTARKIISKHRLDPQYTAPRKRGGPFHVVHNETSVMAVLSEYLSGESVGACTLKDMQDLLRSRGFTQIPSRTTLSRYLRDHHITRGGHDLGCIRPSSTWHVQAAPTETETASE